MTTRFVFSSTAAALLSAIVCGAWAQPVPAAPAGAASVPRAAASGARGARPLASTQPPRSRHAPDSAAMPGHDMAAMPGHDMAAMPGHDMPARPAGAAAPPARPGSAPPATHDMSAMPGMDMTGSQAHDTLAFPGMPVPAAPGHDMSTMPGHDMAASGHALPGMAADGHAMSMQSALGLYSMTRDGSGTSWQPDATPMPGVHWMAGDFSLMAHGYLTAIHDRQTGPRGDTQTFAESMAMLMGNRPLGPGTLGLRAMVSLDPSMGKSGYPLLFQTGETADGRTPLVDRQHPHDLFMELSASYRLTLGEDGAVFGYLGLPGEPALGPTAFMHRFSGSRNPEAPLTHHWLDSTHITFGVATLGVSKGPVQVEASWFNGREPDQYRWNIETRHFDSWSARLSWNPSPALSMQVSHGDLSSPEQLEPDTRVRRTTASISHHLAIGADQWATTLAYGLNRKSAPDGVTSEPGWLLESTYALHDTHTFFGRAEQVANRELLAAAAVVSGQPVRVRELSVGYIHDFARSGPVKWGVGGLVGVFDVPSALTAAYGRNPRSYLLFLQGRL